MTEQGQDKIPGPDPGHVAKQASLVALAQYIAAINGNNIVGEESQQVFGLLQQVASLILLDALRGYVYTQSEPATPQPPPTPIRPRRKPPGESNPSGT